MKVPIDKTDIILLVGLFILGGGLWLYDPKLALCVVGGIVTAMALWSALKG